VLAVQMMGFGFDYAWRYIQSHSPNGAFGSGRLWGILCQQKHRPGPVRRVLDHKQWPNFLPLFNASWNRR
ncbi:MAG: hypothetical protein M3P47_01955, partial [Pseudomonadota bacterium]|nr:hypothetical protein [Pseudomonadota bacterium]